MLSYTSVMLPFQPRRQRAETFTRRSQEGRQSGVCWDGRREAFFVLKLHLIFLLSLRKVAGLKTPQCSVTSG